MAARITNAGGGHYPGLFLVQFDIDRAAGETDTGFDFRAGDVIMTAWVDTQTLEATQATKTVDVGLLSSESGGDADGILDGVSVAAAGVTVGKTTITTGSNTKFAATTTRGALLEDFQAGTDVDKDEGMAYRKEHVCDGTAKSLTYTNGGAFTEFVGKGYVLFFRSPQRLG